MANVGHAVVDTLLMSPDFQLCAIVSASKAGQKVAGLTVQAPSEELPEIDVAILAQPSRSVSQSAAALLKKGICTVDSFDIHDKIPEVWEELSKVAKEHNSAAIIAAGWDPGTDSIIRALLLAMSPAGNYLYQLRAGYEHGPHCCSKSHCRSKRRSQSHNSDRNRHTPPAWYTLKSRTDMTLMKYQLRFKTDKYFVHDETHVIQVPNVSCFKGYGTRCAY